MAFNLRDNKLTEQERREREGTVDAFFNRAQAPREDDTFVAQSTQEPEISATDRYGEQEFVYTHERSAYLQDHPEDVLMRWQGPEYEVYEKSATWYLVVGLVLVAIIIYALVTNSPIMAIVFVLIGVVGYLYVGTPPHVMDFGLTYEGVVVGNRMYRYDDIDSFWIFYEPPHTRVISLHMQGRFTPYIHIPLHQLDPVDVRDALLQFVHEKKQEHSMVDTLERVLHI